MGVPETMKGLLDPVGYDLADGCLLEAFWVDRTDSIGNRDLGPSAVVVVHGSEILKFDCYGELGGHYHVSTPYPRLSRNGLHGRIQMPEKTVGDQIDRAIFELENNLTYYLQTHPRAKVCNARIDPARLATVCGQMKAKMLADEKTYRKRGRRH